MEVKMINRLYFFSILILSIQLTSVNINAESNSNSKSENSKKEKKINETKDERGMLKELLSDSSTNEEESEKKAITSEILISKTEDKAIKALEGLIKKRKGTQQEADLLNRLAELYMRKAKSGRFFDLQRDNKKKVMSLFPIPDQKGQPYISKAVNVYQEIIEKHPKFIEMDSVLFNAAFALQQLGKKQSSESYYRKLIHEYPNSKMITDSLLALGELLYDQGKFREAQLEFEKIEKFPDSRVYSYGIYKLAWSLYNQKSSSQAILKLKNVIEKNPSTLNSEKEQKGYYLRKESLRDMVLFIGEVLPANELYPFFKKMTTDEELGQSMFDMSKLYDSYSKLKDIHIFLNEFINKEPLNSFIVRSHILLADTFETLKKRELVLEHYYKASEICTPGSEWRLKQTEDEITHSCTQELRKNSLDLARKWWEIWQKNKKNKEFSELTEKILRLIIKNESPLEPDYKSRVALAELLFQSEKFEEASDFYKAVSESKSKDQSLIHDSLYGALFAKEKSIEVTKTDLKFIQKKELIKRYVNEFPNGEHYFPVKYNYAVILYEEKLFKESFDVLKSIADKTLIEDIRVKAEDLMLDIYNIEKRYKEIKDFSAMLIQKTKDQNRKEILTRINEESHYSEMQESIKNISKIEASNELYKYYKIHPKSKLGKDAFLNSVSILFSENAFLLAAQRGEEYLETFKDYEKKVEMLKEIARAYSEIGELSMSIKNLEKLIEVDKKERQKYQEVIADFYVLENKNKEARKIYNQMLLELPKDKRIHIFGKIKSTLDNETDRDEIKKIEKIIFDNEFEPYATEILNKKAKDLFDGKKYSECYELTNKILKRNSSSEARSHAKLLQALIFEKELVSQSVKTSNESKLGLVIQLKTEKLDKAQQAYLSVTKMTTEKRILLEAFQGVDRSLQNYIHSLQTIQAPASFTENDVKDLKKQLDQILEPIVQKRVENLNSIKVLDGVIATGNTTHISDKDFFKPEIVKLNIKDFDFILPVSADDNSFSTIDKTKIKVLAKTVKCELDSDSKFIENETKSFSKVYACLFQKDKLKSALLLRSILSQPKLYHFSLYLSAVFFSEEGNSLKARWLLEKVNSALKDKETLLAGLVKYELSRLSDFDEANLYLQSQGNLIFLKKMLEKNSDLISAKYLLASSNLYKENQKKSIDDFKGLFESKSLISNELQKSVILIYTELLSEIGQFDEALKLLNKEIAVLDTFHTDKYKLYLQIARIYEVFKKNPDLAIKNYDFANKESSSSDIKNRILNRIELLKSSNK